ncbi:MAG: Rrf2 family transcriptional regulator [Lachnospiraceae bacterium]
MRVSTRGRYALRMMLDLAMHENGEYIALKDISARQGVSVKYLEQIVSVLSKADMLKSVRGPQGGYKLAKSPDSYTVGDILRVTEGSLAPVACLDAPQNGCPRAAACTTLGFWQELYDAVCGVVDYTTLADLADRTQNGGADVLF